MSKLKYVGKLEFIDLFHDVTKGLPEKEVSTLVWELLNDVWNDGCAFGKDDVGKDDV